MTSKLLLFEYSSFKISEDVGAYCNTPLLVPVLVTCCSSHKDAGTQRKHDLRLHNSPECFGNFAALREILYMPIYYLKC